MADRIIVVKQKSGCGSGCGLIVIFLLLIPLALIASAIFMTAEQVHEIANRPRASKKATQKNNQDNPIGQQNSIPIAKTDSEEKRHKTKSIQDIWNGRVISMRVVVRDNTKEKPIDEKGEVWIRGIGSWWLHGIGGTNGSESKETEPQTAGHVDYIAVYADGRDSGYEIFVPYVLSAGMTPDKTQNDLEISISDDYVTARGKGIKNFSGKNSGKWKRYSRVVPGGEAKLNRVFRQIREKAKATAASEAALYRFWNGKTGKVLVFGKFVNYSKGTVHLIQKVTGEPFEFKLAELSKADQKWLRSELKARKAANKKKKR